MSLSSFKFFKVAKLKNVNICIINLDTNKER